MRIRAILTGTLALLVMASAFYYLGRSSHSFSGDTDPASVNSTNSTGRDLGQLQPQSPQIPSTPIDSGDRFHALDLLTHRPFPDQGRLITLDPIAQPSVDDDGRVLQYVTYPGHIPVEADARGLKYKQMLGTDICIYEIYVNANGHGGPSGGQISLERASNMTCPDPELIWSVEPDGVEEVTLNDGSVKQLPRIKFWSYGQSTSR